MPLTEYPCGKQASAAQLRRGKRGTRNAFWGALCKAAAIKPLPAGHLLLSVIEGCRQMSSSEPNPRRYQPGLLGIPHRPDAIASVAVLVGRGCVSAPDPAPGTMSPSSSYRTCLSRPTGAVERCHPQPARLQSYDLPLATSCR